MERVLFRYDKIFRCVRARLEEQIDEWCKKRWLDKHKIWNGNDPAKPLLMF